MDYMDEKEIRRFIKVQINFLMKKRIKELLMTTKASSPYTNLNLKKMIQFYLEEKVLECLNRFIK